ncbi:MAG: hypothetical protein INR73_03250 [Williamsia sp.]|nr:hypothetical protein [Williamsia sp.]
MRIYVAGKHKIAAWLFVLFALLNLCSDELHAQSYGLTFSSHEVVPEKRTSLDLTGSDPICFSQKLDLTFELSFVPDYITYFGYVFRLINDKGQNIDLIYDQKTKVFRLVAAETFININLEIGDEQLRNGWTKLLFSIDAAGGISCAYNGRTLRSKTPGLKSTCFKLIFGACNEHDFISRDLPPMRLKDVGIRIDGKDQYFWPLNELEGASADDHINHKPARVINPAWIKPTHDSWTELRSFAIRGRPSMAFDPEKEMLYIVSADTLYTMEARNTLFSSLPLSVSHANLLSGNQSVYNPANGKLYNFYTDQHSVATFDFTSRKWNHNFENTPVTEFWQVNKFVTDTSLYVIGGYGQLKYKNTVQKFSFASNSWSILKPGGDFLAPRYLAALGTTASADTAYILGGYGSKEGDQLLSPRHFYDLLLFDVRRNKFRKLYSLAEPDKPFVFANSIVLDSSGQNYYALIFPNDRFKSNLQLIRGSLQQPMYTPLGKPLPYSFSDVKSFADLYYCKRNNSLMAATMYTNPDEVTEVRLYKINFPVNDLLLERAAGQPGSMPRSVYLGIVAGLLVAGAGYFLWARRAKSRKKEAYQQREKQAAPEPVSALPADQAITTQAVSMPAAHESLKPAYPSQLEITTPVQTIAVSAPLPEIEEETTTDTSLPIPVGKIMLFGNFEVVAADGSNITKQFTPLLKEMFLLILIDSLRYKKGVTAEKLNDILWNDKDIKDAKNNRSVNLVKLKNILDKVGGCAITRKTGAWKFEWDPSLVKIDLLDYLDIYQAHSSMTHATASRLLAIVEAGAFLQETHYEWIDTLKAEISNFVIESLLGYVRTLHISGNAEKIIAISNAIFSFDELNEHALKLRCKSLVALGRHTLAKNTFDKFKTKYHDIYGEDFKETYHDLVS